MPGMPPPGAAPMVPRPTPPPAAALAAARPPGPGGGMSQSILLFLAGLGFHNFAKAMKELQPANKEKKSSSGDLLSSISGSRAQLPAAISPPTSGTPPLLGGGMQPNLMAMLAQLAASANRGNG